jgi:hypothetical protein
MGASRVIFHQDAIADVKNAVAWYQERSARAALDFIEELRNGHDWRSAAALAVGEKRDPKISSLAISLCGDLLRTSIRDHSVGGCARQQIA